VFFLVFVVIILAVRFRRYPFRLVCENQQRYLLIMSQINKPQIPQRQCNILDYGAIGDGKTKNTQAISQAIADCSQKGGGKVIFPAGKWFTGPIHFLDNIELTLLVGAEINFSDNRSDYLPLVLSRYQGMDYYNYSPLIYARDCQNIAITGKGKIVGNGEKWRVWSDKPQDPDAGAELVAMVKSGVPAEERIFGEPYGLRPSFVQFVNCKNILVQGISIEDGPMWTIHPIYSENVTIDNVKINTYGINTDGIDVDSSKNVLIKNSDISAGDDAISIKSGLGIDKLSPNRPSENVVIENCQMKKGHSGISIGSELTGGIKNIIMKNNIFSSTNDGFKIKSSADRGGMVENIWLDKTQMSVNAHAILLDMFYDSHVHADSNQASVVKNILISNTNITKAQNAFMINSTDKEHVFNVIVTNFNAVSGRGIQVDNVGRFEIDRISVKSKR